MGWGKGSIGLSSLSVIRWLSSCRFGNRGVQTDLKRSCKHKGNFYLKEQGSGDDDTKFFRVIYIGWMGREADTLGKDSRITPFSPGQSGEHYWLNAILYKVPEKHEKGKHFIKI